MGCQSKVSSQLPVVNLSKIARTITAKPGRPSPVLDFHCPACGTTREAYPNYKHVCPGRGDVGYQIDRLAVCGRCEHNRDGVCRPLKVQQPDKPALIDVGVTMPRVRCPLGKWERVQFSCTKCGSIRFNENGLSRCPVCRPPRKPDTVQLPKFVDEPATPNSRFAVITVSTGQNAIDVGKFTIPRIRKYAEFIGADFHLVSDNQCPQYPIANKLRVGRITQNYERSLYLDVDLWIQSDAGNLFDQFEAGSVWMHADADVFDWAGWEDWVKRNVERVSTEQGISNLGSRCYNTGVVLWDQCDASIWDPPPNPIGTDHVSEQFWVESQAIRRGVRDLPSEFNTQWYWRHFRTLEPAAKIIHLANCPQQERLSRFKKLRKHSNADFV